MAKSTKKKQNTKNPRLNSKFHKLYLATTGVLLLATVGSVVALKLTSATAYSVRSYQVTKGKTVSICATVKVSGSGKATLRVKWPSTSTSSGVSKQSATINGSQKFKVTNTPGASGEAVARIIDYTNVTSVKWGC